MMRPDSHVDHNKVYSSHDELLCLAVGLAKENVSQGGGPFGALIVSSEKKIVAAGVNQVVLSKDSTAHAEVAAIRNAQQKLQTYSLKGYTLYSSCAPCIMCYGVIYWSGLDSVFAAASDKEAHNAGFMEGPVTKELWKKSEEDKKIKFQIIEPTGLDASEPFKIYGNLNGPIY